MSTILNPYLNLTEKFKNKKQKAVYQLSTNRLGNKKREKSNSKITWNNWKERYQLCTLLQG